MEDIAIQRDAASAVLNDLGVTSWPIWSKEASEFPWSYSEQETCYILEGEVTVTPDDGEPVEIKAGDLVTFPRGMSCTWNIKQDLRKHYRFE